MRNHIEQDIDATKLQCQLCRATNDIKTHLLLQLQVDLWDAEGSERGAPSLAVDVAKRLGFCWRRATQGFLSKAREETKRALKHAVRARRDGFDNVIDRYNKDKVYDARMNSNGFNKTTMQEWDSLFLERETSPLSNSRTPFQKRQWNYASWDCRSTPTGGRNTAPHHWNYQQPNSQGDVKGPKGGAASGDYEWAGISGLPPMPIVRRGVQLYAGAANMVEVHLDLK